MGSAEDLITLDPLRTQILTRKIYVNEQVNELRKSNQTDTYVLPESKYFPEKLPCKQVGHDGPGSLT